jgi:hypothetical protein
VYIFSDYWPLRVAEFPTLTRHFLLCSGDT